MPLALNPRWVVLLATAASAFGAEAVDYSRDVLPILSANCFPCHGRDASTREARLRLDVRENATTDRQGLVPVKPGKPESSEVIARITSRDEEERMPPADKGRALHPEEIDVIRRWISEGATYREHWAFQPVTRPSPPRSSAAAAAGWDRSPIAGFIFTRLEKENLRPATRASRETRIRRASLDL